MSETATPSVLQYRNSWTVMSVTDVSKALEFYRDNLGIPFDLIVEDENGQVAYIGSPLNLHFTTGSAGRIIAAEQGAAPDRFRCARSSLHSSGG